MVEVLEDEQAVLHDVVRLHPFDVRHETHAAGVVLVLRAIQPVAGQGSDFAAGGGSLGRGHGRLRSESTRVCEFTASQQAAQQKFNNLSLFKFGFGNLQKIKGTDYLR
jgi:hypothetical protein